MIGAILCNNPPVIIELNRGYRTVVDLNDLHLIGDYKWSVHKQGKLFYARARMSRHQFVYMHRLIIGCGHAFPDLGDHKNRDSLDNRRENIRRATSSQNNRNRLAPNKYGFRGVKRSAGARTKPFYAMVKGNPSVYTDHYATAEEAGRAYDRLAIEIHGEFAVLNFPEENLP